MPDMRNPAGQSEADRPISDYAFLGDCHGAALIGRDGGVDWCCLDRFDADPVLSRILDRAAGSFFHIAPDGDDAQASRAYVPATNVLETIVETPNGRVRLLDFMPVQRSRDAADDDYTDLIAPHWLVRIVDGLEGCVPMVARYRPRCGFAANEPAITIREGRVDAEGCPLLAADVPFVRDGDAAVAGFDVSAGERHCFVMGGDAPTGKALNAAAENWLAATLAFWQQWSGRVSYSGRYRDAVLRSCIVLKALTYAPTGALVAAPTTSLPETLGGVRNWDYRFCWLRDACFALYALKKLGLVDTTSAFFEFAVRVADETRPRLLPLYGIGGETDLAEREVSLAGYSGSRPVRVGNEAVDQHQLDVYGQLLDLMYSYERLGGTLGEEIRGIGRELADYVAAEWRKPDAGLWEPRIPERRYVHSAIMAWTALDRAIRLLGERPAWVAARQGLVDDILNSGTDPEGGHLVQAMGYRDVDAAVLVAPMVDFPLDDTTLSRTVDAVIRELGKGPLVYRYLNDDGLLGEEGTFLVCAFWLVDALLALGRGDEARTRFEALLARANDVGLYAEEMAEDGTFLGNFPQAFTHLGLLQTALVLDLYDAHGVDGVRGTYADRALRSTERRTLEPVTRVPKR